MGSHKLSWSGAMFDHVCGQMHMDSHWFYSCSNAHKLWCPPKHELINSVNKVSILLSFEMCQGPDVGGRLTEGLVLYISMHCDVVSCADIIHIFRCHVRQMQTRTHCDVVSAVWTFHALCNVVSNMRIDDGYMVTKLLRRSQGLVLECCIHIADIKHQNTEVQVHIWTFYAQKPCRYKPPKIEKSGYNIYRH